MNRTRVYFSVVIAVIFLAGGVLVPQKCGASEQANAIGRKILVVASYHQGYKWVEDIVDSLEQSLPGAEMTLFYMDTKRNLSGAEQKAADAYKLFQELQPDAVITIDDNAQKYFVVPYLKDKVNVPVIFCGVNDDATKYGFPATNVTGVLEKKHYRESISFAQVLKPEISRVAVLYRSSPSNTTNLEQIEKEKMSYSAEVVTPVAVQTLAEALQAAEDLKSKADALILLNMTGITDANGEQMEGHDAITAIVKTTNLITIGASDWEVEAGALCGVIKSGEEQGSLVADLLLTHWTGKKIEELQVVQNMNGQRFINLPTLNQLDIKLRPAMILGTKIISDS